MDLSWVYVILAILVAGAAVISFFSKRKNYGYIITAVIVVLSDIACFLLMGCKNIRDARVILSVYYILCAWNCAGMIGIVYFMYKKKRNLTVLAIDSVLAVVQTAIILVNLFTKKYIVFEKHIFFGQNWWIMAGKAGVPVYTGFSAYNFLQGLGLILIFTAIFMSLFSCDRLFRGRLYVMALMHTMVALVGLLVTYEKMPVLVTCFFSNVCILVFFYYVNFYYNKRFKDSFLDSFADELSDGFLLFDKHDDFIYMNGMLQDLFDGRQAVEFRDKEKLEDWLSHTVYIEGAEVLPWEKDGETRYFRLRKDSIDRSGKKTGTAYILHDTTESVLRLRGVKEANEELERAAKMKSDFLANMSHEIRTPMNAVIGMAELAMREELPKQVVDYLAQIQSSGRNLLNIINDILDFSKIEAGRMEIVDESYEPISEINDISNIMMTRIGEKPIEYYALIDKNVPHVLSGDAMRIRQVIINLTNNAVKFTSTGLVILTVNVEEVSPEEIMLTYHVIDTGQGIKKEDLGKLFESFSQVDSKRNRSVEGTGLGLAISQRLVQAMGGTIGVKSEYGKGSDFYFSIPQKVLDSNCELVVEDSAEKFAYVMNERADMVGAFMEEMEKFGVESRWITSTAEYMPTGRREFFFFEERAYGDTIVDFLKEHEDVTGIILVPFGSDFVPDMKNLHVMRRPQTTISLVMALNGREAFNALLDEHKAYTIDFIAPDARVLIVDDNEINITIAKGLIGPTKIQCFEALSGKQAVEMLEDQSFDIIFMDHMMPDMDGVETTKVIRELIPSAKDIPIVALTANVMEGVKDMFLAAGMNDLVAKPIDIRSLTKCLKTWIPAEKIIKKSSEEPAEAAETVAYDGLDCETAISTLGSAELFKTVVKEYYRTAEDKADAIRKDYDNEDWNGFSIKVHALKSASRQIGAPELGSLAEELEMAGKAENIGLIREKTPELLVKFKELTDKLASYFAEEEAAASDLPPISDEELTTILDKIDAACDDLDMDEMEAQNVVLKEHGYPDEIAAVIRELCRAVDDLDTDLCVELTGKIRELTGQ